MDDSFSFAPRQVVPREKEEIFKNATSRDSIKRCKGATKLPNAEIPTKREKEISRSDRRN